MRDHFDAVIARLEADSTLLGKVHDTALVTSDGLPVVGTYVLVFGGGPESFEDDRLTALQSPNADAVYVYTARAVATTPNGVRSVLTKVSAQMVGHRLVVAGRSCRVEQTDATEIDWDKSTNPILFFGDLEFTVHSSRI